MKVLSVGNAYYIQGGDSRVMLNTEDLLREKGNEVISFAPQSDQNFPSPYSTYFPKSIDISKAGVKDFLKYCYNFDAQTALNKLLEDEPSIEVAHLHVYYGRLTSSILPSLKKHKVPIVQSLHDYKLTCAVYTHVSQNKICEACAGKHFWQALPRRCNRGSLPRTLSSVFESYISMWGGNERHLSHFLAVSHFMERKMLEHGIGKGKISTIHNFIDAEKYEPNFTTGSYFLYFGRLEKVKGLFTLLDAASRIPDVPLYIAGSGGIEADLKTYATEKGYQNVSFLGFKSGNDLKKLIQNSLCTILPSEWYENCPMSVLESLAYGKPVIGADIGGIPELIAHETDGFLFEAFNENALFEQMNFVAKNANRMESMGRSGRLKVETIFNREVHYDKLMALYKSL